MPRRKSIWTKQSADKLASLSGSRKIVGGIALLLLSVPFIIVGSILNKNWGGGFLGIFLIIIIPDIILGIILIVSGISQSNEEKIVQAKNLQRKVEYERKLSQSNIYEIDKMSGSEFEEYLHILFRKLGYQSRKTKLSGDYGADLIIEKDDTTTVVLAKCYVGKVSIKAVQEITSAIAFYHANSGWVVTNSYFTEPAKNLAHINNITLIDRDTLMNLIIKSKEGDNI